MIFLSTPPVWRHLCVIHVCVCGGGGGQYAIFICIRVASVSLSTWCTPHTSSCRPYIGTLQVRRTKKSRLSSRAGSPKDCSLCKHILFFGFLGRAVQQGRLFQSVNCTVYILEKHIIPRPTAFYKNTLKTVSECAFHQKTNKSLSN